MPTTRVSSREFNQDIARAKRAAAAGPVIITDRGRPAYVLQSYEDWRRQSGAAPKLSLLEALADPAGAAIDFDPPTLTGPLFRAADLDS